jgi:hypothetical protein
LRNLGQVSKVPACHSTPPITPKTDSAFVLYWALRNETKQPRNITLVGKGKHSLFLTKPWRRYTYLFTSNITRMHEIHSCRFLM